VVVFKFDESEQNSLVAEMDTKMQRPFIINKQNEIDSVKGNDNAE